MVGTWRGPRASAVTVAAAVALALAAVAGGIVLSASERRLLDGLHFRPVIFLPGFASSRLRVWRQHDCPYGPNFQLGDAAWLSTSQVLLARQCWLQCMSNIDPLTQDDLNSGCKARVDEGLDAIAELDPGYLTGPLSNVWRTLIEMYAEMGFEPGRTMFAAPYDFRLPNARLEQRDAFFLRLKSNIESAVTIYVSLGVVKVGPTWVVARALFVTRAPLAFGTQHRETSRERLPIGVGEAPMVVIAHSHGNTVFRYFVEWLTQELGANHRQEWLDRHIGTYVAVGAPLLGAPEPVKAVLSGVRFGLPITDPQVRNMSNNWGSSLAMLPVVPQPPHPQHLRAGNAPSFPTNYAELDVSALPASSNFTSRPRPRPPAAAAAAAVDVAPDGTTSPGTPAGCSVGDATWVAEDCDTDVGVDGSAESTSTSARRLYYHNDLATGFLFEDLEDVDPALAVRKHQLKKFYHDDPVVNTLTPWTRPPIHTVVAVYGINRKTPVGYSYRLDPTQCVCLSGFLCRVGDCRA